MSKAHSLSVPAAVSDSKAAAIALMASSTAPSADEGLGAGIK